MDSKLHSRNRTELLATAAVETEIVADHPTVITELAPAAETTIPEKRHSLMAITETESEIPATAVEVASEKEVKPVTPVDCVFRVIVPTFKSIFGQNGELINKMCHETGANIHVLEGPIWHPYRVVLISGKEDIEAPLSPAMDAVIRVFKCVNGFPENESDGLAQISFCSIRLLVPSMQAMSLIGKQGSLLNTTQEKTRCSTRILPSDEVSTLSANPDMRVVDIHGEGLKVLQALEAVLGRLRMFLHDATSTLEKHQVMSWAEKSMMHANTHPQTESQFSSSGPSCIDPVLSTNCSPGFVRKAHPSITQVTQRMSISIRKAADIIGVGGKNIADIGRRTGAVLTVQEKKGLHNEIAIVIKGTSSQVMAAKKLLRIKVRTVKDWGRPAVLNKPTFLPQDGTTATSETPVKQQKEPTVCSSLIQVPQSRHRPISHVTVAPSGLESIKEPKRNKISWNVNVVKTFLDACIHEITINGRDGGILKAISWQKVGGTLKASHNFSVDDKQMKKYFYSLKGKYRAWVSLKNKTGNKYDPSTNTFNLSAKEWRAEMKENSVIGLLKKAPLSFPDLCAQLFDGTISMGIKGCGPGSAKPTPETEIQTDTMCLLSPSSSNPPVKNKQKMGEASLKPQAAVPLVPSSAETETLVEPQKELMVCSSLVEVPPELPHVQSATAYVAVETKAEVPTEWPEVQLMAMETEAELPTELPPVQPATETKAVVPPELPEVQLIEIETEAEVSVELGQVQPAIETKAEVPTKLPKVQPVDALEAIVTKLKEPVEPVSTDDSKVVDEPMKMQVEEPVVLTGLDRAFSGPDHTAPGFFRTGIDQALTGPNLDRVHPYKDLPPPSHRCNLNCRSRHPSHRRTLSPPPHVAAVPSGFFRTGIDQALTGPNLDRHPYKDLPPPSHRCNLNCRSRHPSHRRTLSPLPHVAAAPSGMESIKEPQRNRYHWNDSIVETFLDACIHEIAINGQEGGSLQAMSWKKVGEMLKASHNFSIDSKQMKNYFDGLKSKYKAWVSLKHKTGNKYDPSTNMFNLTDKEWETEMKENECIEELRKVPLRFPDLCSQLFDSGIRSRGPSFAEHIPETKMQKETMSSASPSSYNPPTKNKQKDSQFSSSGLYCFGFDPGLSTICPPGFDRTAGPSVTQAKTVPDGPLSDRTACKTVSFPAFGVNSSFSTTTATGSVPIFANPASTGTSSSFLGFQTSSKTVDATTSSTQPQSTPASSYCGMESIKESEQNKRKKCHHNVAGGPLGLELQAAVSLIPPSAQPLPATEAPVEPQKEPMVEVPPELPQVQPATASVGIETKRTMSVFEEDMVGVLKMIAEKMNKPEPPPKPTFEDCEKKLNELGWPKDDPLHVVAFAIFCDKNDKYRECWMKLHPERCAKWVRMIGRSKSYL